MKKSLLYFVFVIICSCKTVDCVDTKACDYFLATYKRLEVFSNSDSDGTIDNADVVFIIRLTKIMPDYIEGIDIIYTPTKQNLRDWKKWYNKNKHKLYWDEKEQKVKLRQ